MEDVENRGPKAAVFNTSQGTWRMLMHWKTMFDRYYCIKTENIYYISHYFLHCFVSPFHKCLANVISTDYLRREEVVLTRLRIGHTRLTHSYLLKREDQPFCISCNELFTVKHFLIDCIEFSHVRRQFFQTNDLRYLFENVPADNILVFSKHINLFNKV